MTAGGEMFLLTPVAVPVQRSKLRFLPRNILAGFCDVRQSKPLDRARGSKCGGELHSRSLPLSPRYSSRQHLRGIYLLDVPLQRPDDNERRHPA